MAICYSSFVHSFNKIVNIVWAPIAASIFMPKTEVRQYAVSELLAE